MFYNLGDFPKIYNYPPTEEGIADAQQALKRYGTNLSGMSMVISTQICFSATLYSLLMIPLETPVITRELANKMYSPTVCYLARFISTALIQIPIPIITIVILFWNLGIDTTSENMGWMLLFGNIANLVFTA